jgi:hypothetical protein
MSGGGSLAQLLTVSVVPTGNRPLTAPDAVSVFHHQAFLFSKDINSEYYASQRGTNFPNPCITLKIR